MPSPAHVTLAVLVAAPSLFSYGPPQSKPQSKPTEQSRPQSKPSQPSKRSGPRNAGRASRGADRTRSKYIRRQLPREQRRLKIPGSQAAVHAGLVWLKKHQSEDGRWDCDEFMRMDRAGDPCDGAGNAVQDVGVTGLALLAFLGDGNTTKAGLFQPQVKKAVAWLVGQQSEKNGLIGSNRSHDFMYGHAIATYALVEAYGLSRSAALKKNAQAAINYLEWHRNPYSVWRYQPRDNDNDMSITSWALMAYRSAKDFDLDVKEQVFKIAATYMDQLTDPTNGRCGYSRRGSCSSRHVGAHSTNFPPQKGEAMTAASMFCRLMLGQTPERQPIIKLQADLIMTRPPKAIKDGSIDLYYWYYASHALYQIGGEYWRKWHINLSDAIVKTQRNDGNFMGSWNPDCCWGHDGGRVYSTAMCILSLQSEYRYARLLPQ